MNCILQYLVTCLRYRISCRKGIFKWSNSLNHSGFYNSQWCVGNSWNSESSVCYLWFKHLDGIFVLGSGWNFPISILKQNKQQVYIWPLRYWGSPFYVKLSISYRSMQYINPPPPPNDQCFLTWGCKLSTHILPEPTTWRMASKLVP